MKIYDLSGTVNQTSALPRGCVTALGFFDGVHLGHASLIAAAREYADTAGDPLCVWTFDSLPKANRLITDNEEKCAALASIGVNCVVFEDYAAVRDMAPDVFFEEYILKKLSPSAVFCGFNFHYGQNAAGDADSMKKAAHKHSLRAVSVPPYEIGGKPLSSTHIRALIGGGEIEAANKLLVRPYSFTSFVMHGSHIGRSLGFPTVNQYPSENKLLPPLGVYACTVELDGTVYAGVCNIGIKPTVNKSGGITIETHIFDFDGDAYGKTITVSPLSIIRRETKFESREELSRQIRLDIVAARKITTHSSIINGSNNEKK